MNVVIDIMTIKKSKGRYLESNEPGEVNGMVKRITDKFRSLEGQMWNGLQ